MGRIDVAGLHGDHVGDELVGGLHQGFEKVDDCEVESVL
jgi:hypothetical protein